MPTPSPGDSIPSTSTSGQGVAKIKLEEEISENQTEEKAKTEEERKGSKRSISEWEGFAKRLKEKAEQRAVESKKPGECVDIDDADVVRDFGVVSWGRVR